jgi:hypothetical protein
MKYMAKIRKKLIISDGCFREYPVLTRLDLRK